MMTLVETTERCIQLSLQVILFNPIVKAKNVDPSARGDIIEKSVTYGLAYGRRF